MPLRDLPKIVAARTSSVIGVSITRSTSTTIQALANLTMTPGGEAAKRPARR